MADDRHVAFILNPASAAGLTRRRFERLRSHVEAAFPQMDVHLTKAAGHATELTRQALDAGADLVVAVGGDGTINEVLNGFFDDDGKRHSKNAAMGVMTSGTGGDFRKTFGWGTDPLESLTRLKRGNVDHIDVGRMWCTGADGKKVHRLFLNIGSFGLSGRVDEEVGKSGKSMGGKPAFMLATVRAMIGHKKARVRLTFDDDAPVDKDLTLLALGNGQYFGGGMWIAPTASPTDGLLDAVGFGDVGPRYWLTKGWSVYKGQHLKQPEVLSRRCHRLLAEPVDGSVVKIDLDGELPGQLPAEFSVMEGALPLVV